MVATLEQRPVEDADEETALLSSSEDEDVEIHIDKSRARRLSRRVSTYSVNAVTQATQVAPAFRKHSVRRVPSLGPEIRPSLSWDFISIVLCILVCVFMGTFDGTIVASTYTTISSSFNAASTGSWLSTAYLLTSTSLGPLYAKVSDSVGRRPPYITGIFIFTLGCFWCSTARSMPELIAARALSGIGGSGAMGMGQVLMGDIIPVRKRGLFQALNNLSFGAGGILGASMGGLIADTVGWRWSFLGQVPIGLLALLLVVTSIPNIKPSTAESIRDFDFRGSFFLTTSVFLFILGLNLGGNFYPWRDPIVISILSLSLVLGVALLILERRVKSPVFSTRYFATSPRGNLILSNFLTSISNYGILFTLPIFFQTVLFETATVAGARLAVPSTAGCLAAISGGLINTRYNNSLKPMVVLGAFCASCGPVLLSLMRHDSPEWVFAGFLVPANFGQGLLMPTTMITVLLVSSRPEYASVTSTLALFRQLGMVIGVAASSAILQNALGHYLEAEVEDESLRQLVRASVSSVRQLPPDIRMVVSDCYQKAIIWVFGSCALLSSTSLILVLFAKIPKM